MARNFFTLTNSAAVALVAATEKTVLQLVSATNTIVVVQEVTLTFDGAANSAVPVIVKIQRQTSAGTMTARTPLKTKDTSTTLTSTGAENASAEPTAGNLIDTFHVHPQAGVIHTLPLPDGEIELASASRLGVSVVAPAAVNCLCTIRGEE